jgi:hypothetical protein
MTKYRKNLSRFGNEQRFNYSAKNEIRRRDEFSDREVGLSHPDLSSFIRLNDSGDIEIFAGPEVGIIISAKSNTISLFADTVKINTKEDGLKWNTYNFNYSANTYREPTLVKINKKRVHSAINNVTYYLDNIGEADKEETQNVVTINNNYGFSSNSELDNIPEQNLQPIVDYSGLTEDQIGLLQIYVNDFSNDHIRRVIDLVKSGYSVEESHILVLGQGHE